jgi:lysophospholipase L1-like esterase
MRRHVCCLSVFISAFILSIFCCDVFAVGVTRIMPLGDSITRGWYGSVYDWGYRKPLYDLLTSNDYSFDFVGRKLDGNFQDPNHEGRDGWHADELLNGRASAPGEGKLADWLITDQPDVILLHIGTNDIRYGDQNASEVSSILDVIDAYEVNNNKHITVVLALIINQAPPISATTVFNNSVNAMALGRIANGDDIIIVNMETALNYSIDMADTFHPNDYGYAKMAQVWYDALSQCDCVSKTTVAISGRVLEADGNTPVEGLLIRTESNDVNAVTDADGFYELSVQSGWSGVVVPQKDGYEFEPNGYIFTDVNQDCPDADYLAIPKTCKISGYVLDMAGIEPICDVNVAAENGGGSWTSKIGGGSALTDTNGYYEISVDYNWTGAVKPSKSNFVLDPNARSYTDVNEDYIEQQDYMGTELTIRITGSVKNDCNAPVAGVLVDANNGGSDCVTDVNGFYEVWVSEEWQGTITPAKANFTFTPSSLNYDNVLTDIVDQNYTADSVYDLDCSGNIDWGDISVIAQNWLQNDELMTGGFIIDGRIDFLDFAEFADVWEGR